MDFNNAEKLLELCQKNSASIADIMRQREAIANEVELDVIEDRMKHSLKIMRDSVSVPTKKVLPSIGGLIGGEALKLKAHLLSEKSVCGTVLSKVVLYSQAVLEVNSSMGVIVAAPTAGSSGVLPAILIALEEEFKLSEDTMMDGLFTAGAIGYLFMKNASISGAEAGCQAEIGVASAMAAAASTAMMGGTPQQCLDASAIAIGNLLGLICDPVAGLVEFPCQSRNAMGASNGLISSELVLSGIKSIVPFDEMVETMYQVGLKIPIEFRETAMGGCATTPTGCAHKCRIFSEE